MPLEDVGFSDLYTFTRSETAEFLGSLGLIESVAANLPAVAWSSAGVALGIVLNGPVVQLLANTSDPQDVFANPFAVTETANAGTDAADAINTWAKENQMFVVIEVLPVPGGVLIFYTRQVSPEEEADLNGPGRDDHGLSGDRRRHHGDALHRA